MLAAAFLVISYCAAPVLQKHLDDNLTDDKDETIPDPNVKRP